MSTSVFEHWLKHAGITILLKRSPLSGISLKSFELVEATVDAHRPMLLSYALMFVLLTEIVKY